MSAHPTSIGIGTHHGELTDQFSERLKEIIVFAHTQLRLTTIDTAINYRCQRSERAIGDLIRAGAIKREHIFLSTKGGFIPFDNQVPQDIANTVYRELQLPLRLYLQDIHDYTHCIHPRFIEWSFHKSLQNLATSYVDAYFIHTPEFALSFMEREEWETRLMACFDFLEKQVKKGKCLYYGIASWRGVRVMPQNAYYVSLERLFRLAEDRGCNHFKAIVLPINPHLKEYTTLHNQKSSRGKMITVQDWAHSRNFNVFAASPLMHGYLIDHAQDVVPKSHWHPTLTPAQNLILWTLRQGGVTATFVGTTSQEHISHAAALINKQ